MRKWMMAGSAAAIVVAAAAHADGTAEAAPAPVDVRIADDVGGGQGLFSGAGYGKSERLGHAWLVLHYETHGPCQTSDGECDADVPVNVGVPGLAYDAAARKVVYRGAGGDPVVCAEVRRRVLGEAIDPTGACTIRVVKVDRVVDDGFEGRKDRRDELHFTVRSAGADAAVAAARAGAR